MLGFFKVGSEERGMKNLCRAQFDGVFPSWNLASAEFSEFNESDKINMN